MGNILLLTLALLCTFAAVTTWAMIGIRIVNREFAKRREDFLENVSVDLNELFSTMEAEKLFYLNIISILGLGIFGFIISRNPIVMVILAGVGFFLPKIGLNIAKKNRLKKFNTQLVDGITLIANSARSGLGIIQGIDMLVKEMRPPISQEFSLMLQEYKLGVSLEDALNHLAERVKSDEIKIVVTAIVIARIAGGKISEVLEQIAHTIRERNKIQGKINALTAQGKLQGIVVGLLPILLGVAIYYINPDLMLPMFHTLMGWAFLAAIVVLEIIGAFLIKKIVTIDI